MKSMKISGWAGVSIMLLVNNQALALEFPFGNGANGEEAESLSGELIYSSHSYGGQVYSLDLQSGERRTISDWPPVWISSLSRISATRILVSLKEYADPERYKGVEKYDKSKFPDSTNKYWVAVYDLLSGGLKIIHEGEKAAYFREYEKILYYSRTEDALIIASLDGIGEDGQVSVDIGAKLGHNEYHKPIQVSGTEFLYPSYASGSYEIWKYDLKLGEARHLDKLDCRLDSAVWVDSMKQLLCEAPAEIEIGTETYYILTGLAGDIRKKFRWRDEWTLPVIPVKNSDSVLLNRESLYIGFNLKEGLVINLYNVSLEIYNLKSGLQKEIINRFTWATSATTIWVDK